MNLRNTVRRSDLFIYEKARSNLICVDRMVHGITVATKCYITAPFKPFKPWFFIVWTLFSLIYIYHHEQLSGCSCTRWGRRLALQADSDATLCAGTHRLHAICWHSSACCSCCRPCQFLHWAHQTQTLLFMEAQPVWAQPHASCVAEEASQIGVSLCGDQQGPREDQRERGSHSFASCNSNWDHWSSAQVLIGLSWFHRRCNCSKWNLAAYCCQI